MNDKSLRCDTHQT